MKYAVMKRIVYREQQLLRRIYILPCAHEKFFENLRNAVLELYS